MHSKILAVAIFALFVPALPLACTAKEITPTIAQKSPTTIALPSNFQYPNGIAHASDGTLYVGSITSGQILRIAPNGEINTLFPGNKQIFAATSLRLDEQRGLLWGTSSDFLGVRQADGKVVRRPHRIFAIDLRSGKVQRVVLMPDGGFGNDIAIDAKGGLYVTDSFRPRIHYLPPDATQLQTWAEDEQFRSKQQIGLAGIVLSPDNRLIVNLYSDGKLLSVTPNTSGKPTVEEIKLQRPIENPDGMQFAPDGSLLLLEGAVQSGKGRLLRIRPGSQGVETLAENLISPVNLAIAGNEVWVTESQIRHRLLPGQEKAVPDRFLIHRFRL
jgi:sugar lactone lactonase YvrE